MKNFKTIIAALFAVIIFTGCEREDSDVIPSNESSAIISLDNSSVLSKDKIQNNKSIISFTSEDALKSHMENIFSGNASSILETSTGWDVRTDTYDQNKIDYPSDPSLVYNFPSDWDAAWAEGMAMAADTGCWVTFAFGYGKVAVNLDC